MQRVIRTKGNNAVNIMRGTRWCNPFVVGKDGSLTKVSQLFEEYVKWRLKQQVDWLDSLKGKDLYCCCDEGEYCHGRILIKFIEIRCLHCRNETPYLVYCSECNEELCSECYDDERHGEHGE